DRNGAADAEQPQVHDPCASDKQHHSEGVNGENGWKGPDGFRFAHPSRQSAVMQRGQQFHDGYEGGLYTVRPCAVTSAITASSGSLKASRTTAGRRLKRR